MENACYLPSILFLSDIQIAGRIVNLYIFLWLYSRQPAIIPEIVNITAVGSPETYNSFCFPICIYLKKV